MIGFNRGKKMKGNKRDLILKAKELELELEFINRSRKQDAEKIRLEEKEKALEAKVENAILQTQNDMLETFERKHPYSELKEILNNLVDKIATIEIKGLNKLLSAKRKD